MKHKRNVKAKDEGGMETMRKIVTVLLTVSLVVSIFVGIAPAANALSNTSWFTNYSDMEYWWYSANSGTHTASSKSYTNFSGMFSYGPFVNALSETGDNMSAYIKYSFKLDAGAPEGPYYLATSRAADGLDSATIVISDLSNGTTVYSGDINGYDVVLTLTPGHYYQIYVNARASFTIDASNWATKQIAQYNLGFAIEYDGVPNIDDSDAYLLLERVDADGKYWYRLMNTYGFLSATSNVSYINEISVAGIGTELYRSGSTNSTADFTFNALGLKAPMSGLYDMYLAVDKYSSIHTSTGENRTFTFGMDASAAVSTANLMTLSGSGLLTYKSYGLNALFASGDSFSTSFTNIKYIRVNVTSYSYIILENIRVYYVCTPSSLSNNWDDGYGIIDDGTGTGTGTGTGSGGDSTDYTNILQKIYDKLCEILTAVVALYDKDYTVEVEVIVEGYEPQNLTWLSENLSEIYRVLVEILNREYVIETEPTDLSFVEELLSIIVIQLDGIYSKLVEILDSIGELNVTVNEYANGSGSGSGSGSSAAGEEQQGFFERLWNALKDFVASLIEDILEFLKEIIKQLLEIILKILKGLWSVVTDFISGALTLISDFFDIFSGDSEIFDIFKGEGDIWGY